MEGCEMERFKNRSPVVSIIMIIIGLILVIWPGHTLTFMVSIFGWGLIFSGISEAVAGFTTGFFPLAIGGLFMLALGFYFIIAPDVLASVIPVLAGLGILINGAVNLYNAWTGRYAMGYNPAKDIVLSIISIVLGILVLVRPFTAASVIVIVVGIALIYNGIVNLVNSRKNQR